MKRKIVLLILSLLAILLLTSCEPTVYEKPFIIVDKSRYNSEWVEYTYADKNGHEKLFSDIDKYDIGDTLN
jgi:protein involved in sex pheromone biosynthesis